MQPTFLKIILILTIIFGLTLPARAAVEKSPVKAEKSAAKEGSKPTAKSADDKNSEESNIIKSVGKEITGQVSGVSKDYIGVIYQADKNTESEMGILIKGVPVLERVTGLEQIEMGDTVTVEYSEVTERDDNDQEIMKHVATKIIFVKKAPPPPAETSVLTSEEGGQ